ncbi:MAG: DMT family transporter [candidate division Zixibacteria bacterium]|nr:DMT family transporter [candidate division Zixibacteria bacterium]
MNNSPRQHENANLSIGYLYASLSAMMASVLIVAGKWTLHTISPLALSALVFPIGSVVLGLTMIPRKRWKRIFALDLRAWTWTLAFSVLAFVAIWTYWIGLKMMDPTLASFVNRSETLVTISLGILILGERFSRGEGLGAFLVLCGIVLMKFTFRAEYSVGFWVVLFSAVCFGTAEFIAKIAVRYVDPLTLSFLRNVISSVLFWIAVAFVGTSFEGVGSVWWGILIIALVGPVLTRPIYLYALKHIEVSKVALINQSQPVFVAILALLILTQTPAPSEIMGGLFVIGGCLLIIISRKKVRGRNALRARE